MICKTMQEITENLATFLFFYHNAQVDLQGAPKMFSFFGTVRSIMLNCLEGCEIRKTLPVHVALSLLQNHSFSPFSVWVCFHCPLCNTYRGRLLDIGNQVNGQQQSFPESQQTITVVT